MFQKPRMDLKQLLILLLVLTVCPRATSELQPPCPYTCHCFTTSQILCAEERMASLPSNMSKQVKEFIVMTSSVAYLFPNSLDGCPQLTKLVFLNNALRSIHVRAFENLTELQELEISGNPSLDNLLLGTFSRQRNLTKLLLNFNKFKTVLPGMFDGLKQLKTLQLKGNIISHLPEFLFFNLGNLEILDLSQNKLEQVKTDTFAGLSKLEILKLNYNFISNISFDIFHNVSRLTELNLEGNKISELPDGVFSALTNLTVLNLRGNRLRTFSDKVFDLNVPNLLELNLKGNRLAELSSLSSLLSLTDLILSSNHLSYLPEDTFTNLTLLENLDLSENQLTFLPEGIFNGLLTLKTLHLQTNNLTNVPPNLLVDQELVQQLYLSNNQLETIPSGLFDTFLLEHTVRLHGNPWKCDCRMWYLHDWVRRNSREVQMLDRVFCLSPDFLRGRTVVSVDQIQLVCPVSTHLPPDVSHCSLQTFNDTMIMKCNVDQCSPLTVKLQFEEEGKIVKEHVFKNEPELSRCRNDTREEKDRL